MSLRKRKGEKEVKTKNKKKVKKNTSSVFFIALSKKTGIHFYVKYFEEKHLSHL